MPKFLIRENDGSSFEVTGSRYIQDGLSQRIEKEDGGLAWSDNTHSSKVREIDATANVKEASSAESGKPKK